ncbi:MAG: DegT/DnrJ/EryC1/StrS family aminotransferase [Planctomycetia bacterium]|nr:DegT/DnrJ/EryC1/StrS family aminotransferase [Planctomycetia bacterium]
MILAFDPCSEYRRHQHEIDSAIARVLNSGQVILGPEGACFEEEFAAYVGARYGVGVKSGTDALIVALRALGIGADDEVLTVANTAVPTVAAIRATGAIPRFVDVDPVTLLMDADHLQAAISSQTRCVVAVHLYGNPLDMQQIKAIAAPRGVPIVADCAQAHGAQFGGRHVGPDADIGCYSFYPTKNLGGFGDAGLCTTDDARLAAQMRRIRMYGFDGDRVAQCEGLCSRLDELQAAMLRVKLRHLDKVLLVRRRLAERYTHSLSESDFVLPATTPGGRHAYHQYVVRTSQRTTLMEELQRAQIGYGIHYPVPVHLMPAYAWLGYRPGDLPVTERAAEEVLSLPLHVGLSENEIRDVASVLRGAVQAVT